MSIFSCNVEDADLVRMLVKHAHEPTSKLLHPNAVHTQICSQLFANNCSLSCVCSFFVVTLQRKIEQINDIFSFFVQIFAVFLYFFYF